MFYNDDITPIRTTKSSNDSGNVTTVKTSLPVVKASVQSPDREVSFTDKGEELKSDIIIYTKEPLGVDTVIYKDEEFDVYITEVRDRGSFNRNKYYAVRVENSND